MKIDGLNHSNMNPYKKQIDLHETKEAKKLSDQLEISSEAKQLQQQQQSRLSMQRQERVEALKKQVDTGQYHVNPQKTANKFYQFWMDQ